MLLDVYKNQKSSRKKEQKADVGYYGEKNHSVFPVARFELVLRLTIHRLKGRLGSLKEDSFNTLK